MSAQGGVGRSAHWINLHWLSKLRWGAILGQLATIFVAHGFLKMAVPVRPLLLLIGVEVVTNFALHNWLQREPQVGEGAVFAVTVADVLALTGLLYLTGGPFNPFTSLYLVHIALAAAVLSARRTWELFGVSLLSFGSLFLDHQGAANPHSLHGHPESQSELLLMHVQGMWIAFAVAAGFICFFVTRIRNDLAERESDLAEARSRTAVAERLASLATLAAGAAHELASPLGTIAVASRELEVEFGQRIPGEIEMLDDLRLIRAEVGRCRAILDQMAAEGGVSSGGRYSRVTVREILSRAVRDCSRRGAVRVEGDEAALDCVLEVPARAVEGAVQAVIRNAQDASPDGQPVVVAAALRGAAVVLQVRDCGAGMAGQVLERVGQPFFTTKEAGAGMGLGVFLARAVLEPLGGSLTFDSRLGVGTTASISVLVATDGDSQPGDVGVGPSPERVGAMETVTDGVRHG